MKWLAGVILIFVLGGGFYMYMDSVNNSEYLEGQDVWEDTPSVSQEEGTATLVAPMRLRQLRRSFGLLQIAS